MAFALLSVLGIFPMYHSLAPEFTPVFCGVRIAHHFRFLYCVFVSFVFVVRLVLNVFSVSGLSIPDYFFGVFITFI